MKGRPARITSYSTGGNERGLRLLLIKKTEVFLLADSSIEATYGMAVEVAAQWLSSSDIQSARICPHFSSFEIARILVLLDLLCTCAAHLSLIAQFVNVHLMTCSHGYDHLTIDLK